jgi:hypothetical protein
MEERGGIRDKGGRKIGRRGNASDYSVLCVSVLQS